MPILQCQSFLMVSLILLTCSLANTLAADDQAERNISFNRDIRPILSDKCFQCHGPDENTREVDLRFDMKEDAMTFIEPGDVEGSEMMSRILDVDPDTMMPPPKAHKPLSDSEKALLKQWIEQGAVWDEFWAYVPPKWNPVSDANAEFNSKESAGQAGWIDKMVEARLEHHDLSLSPSADKVTLIRRLYFDLIGLPPTPKQVEEFVNNSSPDAYTELVDSLLESQHFGERLAMYWLDLVRYADTVGYHGDQSQNISPYRDWVINSLNDNMPFDQFTREQLAGDLLPDPTLDQKIASGYNRLLQTSHEGGLQPAEYRAIYAADRVRNVSAVWMGATVGCAQCHDHKYDPFTAKDFYSLSAFFADIDDEQHFKDGSNSIPTRRSPEMLILNPEDQVKYDSIMPLENKARKELGRIKKQVKELSKNADKSKAEKNGPQENKQTSELNEKLKAAEAKFNKISKQRKKIESRGAWTMYTRALKKPRTVRVLPRGNWLDNSGTIVEPAVPEFMEQPKSNSRLNRLNLATWLTDNTKDSGRLTARVFANRFWYLYMGVGISKSLDDFGGQGEAPAFPELLDNLAIDFAKDWNIKRMIRQIVLTKTYQQSSRVSREIQKRDPYNQLFARQSRYRLPAELVRDNSLAIAGLLNVDTIGGKSVKPYQPAKYYRHLNFPKREYSHSKDANQWRRGVYVHWQRMFLHPSLKALDAPSREECTCERPRSNTPLAALALLNDPCFVEAARMFAEKIIRDSNSNSTAQRIEFAFQWAVSRKPNSDEARLLEELYESSLAKFKSDLQAAREFLKTGQASVDTQLPPIEIAAWATVARAILNLDETISRN